MNPAEQVLRRLDGVQQGHRSAAFLFGVVKKFGDDNAGSLGALLAYYGFLSLFPLLLLLVTVTAMLAGSDPSLAHRIEHSALAQFPVVGTQLKANIHQLHQHSAVGLVVGILGLLWGSQGAGQAGQYAMAQVWNVPGPDRPGYVPRLARNGLVLLVLLAFLVASSALTGLTALAGGSTPAVRLLSVLGSLVVNLLVYALAFRILTPAVVATRELLAGAAVAGAGWTVLQLVGGELVAHQLNHTTHIYGFFAVVLGLLAWIALGAQVTLYGAELNVVLARHLWPRALVQPPLTLADQRVLADIAVSQTRRPEQEVQVRFTAPPADAPGERVGDPGPVAAGTGATRRPAVGSAGGPDRVTPIEPRLGRRTPRPRDRDRGPAQVR
jgi:YihY family inner membrane protein